MSRKSWIISASVGGSVLLLAVIALAVALSDPPIVGDAAAIQGEWKDSEGGQTVFRAWTLTNIYDGKAFGPNRFSMDQQKKRLSFVADGRPVSVAYRFLNANVLVMDHPENGRLLLVRK